MLQNHTGYSIFKNIEQYNISSCLWFSGVVPSTSHVSVPPLNQESTKVKVTSKKGLEAKDVVGDQLLLPEELLHPFMNRPSETQIHNFFARFSKTENHTNQNESFEDSSTVGAINPRMFERFQSQQESIATDRSKDELDNIGNIPTINDNETVSTSMKLQGQVLKPFLGQMKNKKALFKQKHKSNNDYGLSENSDLPIYTYDQLDLYEPSTYDEESTVYEENVYQ